MLGLCVGVSLANPAWAQKKKPKKPVAAAPVAPTPPPAPTVPTLAESLPADAKADYDSGKVLYGDGDHAGALVKFQSAYDKSKDPRLLWNMAACEKNLRHYAKVLRLLRQYLADGGARLTDTDKKEAQDLLATVEPLTAAIRFRVSEADADVFVDDELIGRSPLEKPYVVDIGMRKIRVRKDDYKEYTQPLAVGGTPEVALDVKLEKIIHEGQLAVNARTGDSIYLDGKLVAQSTWRGTLPSGGHSLRVTAPEWRTYESEIVIQDNQTRTVNVTLEREIKPSSGVPAWAWIAGGVVVAAGAGVGGYFLFRPKDPEPPAGTLAPGNVQASMPLFR